MYWLTWILPHFLVSNNHSAPALQYAGLDLAKRMMEVCIVTDGETGVERVSGMKTDAKGWERPARLLRKSDVVGMEACAYEFLLAEAGCVV